MDKIDYCKIYAYNKIMEHLNLVSHMDSRPRERRRALVGFLTVEKWYKEGENYYERRHKKEN